MLSLSYFLNIAATCDTVLLLLCYFYVYGMRRVVLMAKDSAGIYRQDQWFAIIEAIINIVLSIALVLYTKSINGIILANTLSMLIIPMWTQPYLVYKHVLGEKVIKYYIKYVLYAGVTVASFVLTYFVAEKLVANTDNLFIELILRAVVCVAIPNVINIILFCRTSEFKQLLQLVLGVLNKKIKKG